MQHKSQALNNSNNKLSSEMSNKVPTHNELYHQLVEASALVDDIILKKYLTKLTDLELIPLDTKLKKINSIRLFKINEMVYQNNEYSTYKFASVFNSVQNLNCGIFIIVNSNGRETDFYMGVRSLDEKRTTKSLKDTLKNALSGQFPGVKTEDLFDSDAESFLSNISSTNIATVSCVAKNKDKEFNDNENFIQGLEKLAIAMHGQSYTAIVLAKSTTNENLESIRKTYETIYTQLSPFANMQVSYGTNTAFNISDAFSNGTTTGTSYSATQSRQTGTSYSGGLTTNESKTTTDPIKGIVSLLGAASIITAPLTGGASYIVPVAITAGQISLNTIATSSNTSGMSKSETWTENSSKTYSETDSTNKNISENYTKTQGVTSGTSDNMQLSMQNKTIINILERIDEQLKRLDECASLGMWESAAYFLSNNQETAEMAAGTYKALMNGENSGVEVSAINFWGRKNEKTFLMHEYITNFIHPIFAYHSESAVLHVTASSLISGNELAIQMGLPRKSLCGFPVVEHADFGKEVVKYNRSNNNADFTLGNVFSMGSVNDTEVRLDRDSLAMHTFITGATGSGKSNVIYEILHQLRITNNIPFLVIEPAKGEYKNIFGHLPNVTVYGTNHKKSKLLTINPFSFPNDIHILEHLDKLVELFNVCWPMYAAMPAILKDAMERSYISVGWDLSLSENSKGKIFPNFADLLEEIEHVINESSYSSDSKGDYIGALCTRVKSLTTGLNRMMFSSDDLADIDIFDRNVIIDLSRVGSTETKSLIMGLLIIKLNEYRMTSGKMNSPLCHITVLEEAHNLLKKTSMEQSPEGGNLTGKAVELLSNSIAEMRTFGEGFIIADQSPGLLDMSVIRNTNTKIILRLPEQSDRELVGFSASLNIEQIKELSKLERGVAAIYQNDWVEPVLVKVNKCEIEEKPYHYDETIKVISSTLLMRQIIYFLIQGRINERLNFDIDEIESHIYRLGLSTRKRAFIEDMITEFRYSGKLLIWRDDKFKKLSSYVTNLLSAREKVKKSVLFSTNNIELTNNLSNIVKQIISDASEEIVLTISQCFMKDLSVNNEELDICEKIYKQWVIFIKEKGATL